MSRSRLESKSALGLLLALLLLTAFSASAKTRWNEINIGPFFVDFQQDSGTAREYLNQLEQLRWVLGGLLDSKDLPSVWPIRAVLGKTEKTNPRQFVWQNGHFVLICTPGAPLPLEQVAAILLDANTPRLPPEAESGLLQLFGTLQAHGSRVTWGSPDPHPDLAWARMQLFATKFEYGLSFHIFVSSLRNGSQIPVAEKNAFGKDPAVLEKEVAATLAAGNWQPVAVSGRPLDPKRDFGEHLIDDAVVQAYIADAALSSDPRAAEAAYKSAIESGSAAAMPLGYEGLAALARQSKEDPRSALEDAMRAGSTSALVYVAAAKGRSDSEALPLLKKAAQLNPLWGEPVYQQAQLAADPVEKEALLKKAAQLDPRATQYLVDLARVQIIDGHSRAAQGSWLRAEDSAATDPERQRIHDMRLASEEGRLEAAEAERRHEQDSVQREGQRAQNAQADRVRAAEEKANRQLNAASEGATPANAIPWEDTVPKRQLIGSLTRVDCAKGAARLSVKDRSGRILNLTLKDPAAAGLSCGVQQPPVHVSLSYAAEPDDTIHTAGHVLTLKLQ